MANHFLLDLERGSVWLFAVFFGEPDEEERATCFFGELLEAPGWERAIDWKVIKIPTITHIIQILWLS